MNATKYSPFVARLRACAGAVALASTIAGVGCHAEPRESAADAGKKAQAPAAAAAPQPPATVLPGVEVAPGVREVGRLLVPRLSECSGLVASRQYPGLFWAHNDGGGAKRQVLFGLSRTGELKAEFRLLDVMLQDWEDIAIDDQNRLYVGDIGNNDTQRPELAVHRVAEPNPAASGGEIHVQQSWRLRFPGERFDSEGLFVWKDHGYLVSKVSKDARAEIYRFPLAPAAGPVTLEFVARTRVESPVAAADLSPDGRYLALIAKSGAFLLPVDGDISRAHKEKGYQTRYRHDHIEGCAFVADGLLAVAESRELFLFTDPPFVGKVGH